MDEKLTKKDILKIANKTLTNYKICDYCIGRIFSDNYSLIENKKAAEKIRKNINNYKEVKTKDCWLCDGILDEKDTFIKLILEELKAYEFKTFLVGVKIDEEILEKEKQLAKLIKIEELKSIKSELKREIGKKLEKILKKEVNFEKPDIMAVVDTSFHVVELQISSLLIYGRYKKFSRAIPQTKWYCKICQGKGCRKCNYSGTIYKNSVEELISKKFLKETNGEGESFHGAGREDIDVKMLGNGRPFVLEILNPKIRNINLLKIQDEINKKNKKYIEIEKLRFSDRNEISRIKKAKFNKVYLATILSEKPINSENIKKAVLSLQGKKIGQFTPSRVAHRRANMVREKYIYNCSIKALDGSRAVLKIEAESGTYIKELISGDDNKTVPNLSQLLGFPCKVIELDVIEIKGE